MADATGIDEDLIDEIWNYQYEFIKSKGLVK